MHFSGSVYGLQVGAPVVFRGVRIGSVTSIGLAFDRERELVFIPVTADLDRRIVYDMAGAPTELHRELSVADLVERGLRAQLGLQSLLTSQLYVDFDFRPDKPAVRVAPDNGRHEVPTVTTAIEQLKAQIEGVNIKQLTEDVAAIAASARRTLAGPELAQSLRNLQDVLASMKTLIERLDAEAGPLAASARRTLASADRALVSADAAVKRIEGAAARVEGAAERFGALAAPDAPLLLRLQEATHELARTATALRESTAEDSALVTGLQRTLRDVAQAARSVRELTDAIERQPESLLRGRRSSADR